jgi:hypothetical protein
MVWKLTGDFFGLNARMVPLTVLITLISLLQTAHPALAENQKKQDRTAAWEDLSKDLNYGELIEPPEPEENEPNKIKDDFKFDWSFNRGLVGSIVLGVIILALVALLIFLISRHLKTADVRLHGANNLEYTLEELDASMPETDLERHLRLAIERQDYRGAVRVYYIITLRKLHELKLIDWQIDKTNNTYLLELSANMHHEAFARLTETYEVIWYGEAFIDATEFKRIQPAFAALIQALNHA